MNYSRHIRPVYFRALCGLCGRLHGVRAPRERVRRAARACAVRGCTVPYVYRTDEPVSHYC